MAKGKVFLHVFGHPVSNLMKTHSEAKVFTVGGETYNFEQYEGKERALNIHQI